MIYFKHPDQSISFSEAYIMVVMCATVYSKKPKAINSINDIYAFVAEMINVDVNRMKNAMKIALGFNSPLVASTNKLTNDNRLNTFIAILAEYIKLLSESFDNDYKE